MQKSSTKYEETASNTLKEQYIMIKWDLSQGCKDICDIHKSVNVIHHINKLMNKNHIILSMDVEKAFDKIQYLFLIKTRQKVSIDGSYLNIIKAIYGKP